MSYESDLSDKEWDLIKNDFEPTSKRGNAHKHPQKSIMDAILSVLRGGIQWRMMPKDFPPSKTVYDPTISANGTSVASGKNAWTG